MICHKVLNLNVNEFISNNQLIPRPANSALVPFSVSQCNPKIYLKENIYNKLSALGNLNSLIFHMHPNTDKNSIHIDINSKDKLPRHPTLNILIEGQGVMKWFNPTDNGIVKHLAFGYGYCTWENNFGELVDQWVEGKIALVRTDIPHNVWNPFNQERLVVSIRWDIRYSWEETLEWFEKNFP